MKMPKGWVNVKDIPFDEMVDKYMKDCCCDKETATHMCKMLRGELEKSE